MVPPPPPPPPPPNKTLLIVHGQDQDMPHMHFVSPMQIKNNYTHFASTCIYKHYLSESATYSL